VSYTSYTILYFIKNSITTEGRTISSPAKTEVRIAMLRELANQAEAQADQWATNAMKRIEQLENEIEELKIQLLTAQLEGALKYMKSLDINQDYLRTRFEECFVNKKPS
jgi:hypothetical protein